MDLPADNVMTGNVFKPRCRKTDGIDMEDEPSLKKIYSELKELRGEVATLKAAIVPEIIFSKAEMAELRKLKAEAKAGKVTRLEAIGR